ncbi:ankyrin repeat domain-containing protein, partial [Citrobacter sp. AAK_AS5]
HAEIARLLIDHGADINAADSHGTTPLMVAAGYGAQDIVATLEIGGATIDAHDNEGMTALMFAARCGRTEIVQELLSRQADP